MTTPRRVTLEPATKDHPKTYPFRIRHRGEWLDLTSHAVTAFAVKPDGSTKFAPTVSKPTQQDDDLGIVYVIVDAADLDSLTDRTSWYFLDVYVNDEPLSQRFRFKCEELQTE